MEKAEFLAYLESEFNKYNLLSDADSRAKREKKQYLNGLMKASRFFGVRFDELKAVIDCELAEQSDGTPNIEREDVLDIPTFIRQNRRLTKSV